MRKKTNYLLRDGQKEAKEDKKQVQNAMRRKQRISECFLVQKHPTGA